MPREQANGIELEYETYGDAAAPPVILIMGLGEQMGGTEFPTEFCAGLAERGFRVIRFDNRDVGLSTHLDEAGVPDQRAIDEARARGEDNAVPYKWVDMADDVAGLLDALNIDAAHIAGASMGGFIARWVALRHRGKARSLSLIMTGAGRRDGFPPPSAESAASMHGKTVRAATREAAVDAYVAAWRSYNGPGFEFDEPWVRSCAELTYDRAYHPEGVARHVAAWAPLPDLYEAQRTIDVPTVVLHGDADPIFAMAHPEAIVREIPGAELVRIEGMGHEMPVAAWPRLFDAIAGVAERAGAPAS